MADWTLSQRDNLRLLGVHPDLQRVVRHAATRSALRFMVVEGRRTVERQRELFKAGASRTLNSRHLTGHAVDLAPILDDGSIPWNRGELFYAVATAMREASILEVVTVTWGAIWDRPLNDIGGDLFAEHANYLLRYRAERGPGARPLHDSPHYQIRV